MLTELAGFRGYAPSPLILADITGSDTLLAAQAKQQLASAVTITSTNSANLTIDSTEALANIHPQPYETPRSSVAENSALVLP